MQRGDYDEDDDDDDSQENAGGATEEEVRNPRVCLSFSIRLSQYFPKPHYIYIYAFSRRLYPKRLTVHSGYTFLSLYVFPGN